MKITKEELLKENVTLNNKYEALQSKQAHIIEQFSEVLGAPMQSRALYARSESRETYTWEKIFTEVGKLLNIESSMVVKADNERLRDENLRLANRLDKILKSNNK